MISGIVTFLFSLALLVSFVTDYRFFLIYRAVTLFLIPPLLLFSYYSLTPVSLEYSLLGVIFGYGSLWIVKTGYKRIKKIDGVGQGDLELLATIGAYVGPIGAWFTLTLGSVCGIFYALVLMASHKADSQTHLPFGSFLVIGCFIYMCLCQQIITNDSYFTFFINS